MDSDLLDILVCPKCKGKLQKVEREKTLVCAVCQIKYPIRDNIPSMGVADAYDIRAKIHSDEKMPKAKFRVVDGADINLAFDLEKGTCRAIGRASGDPNKTSVFRVDLALEMDENTKRLIMQYIRNQFHKSGDVEGDGFADFKRVPDIVLTDNSLSRLHAMVFYDDAGVGILDLVSKNGTYVNGKEIESTLLKKGDAIELGETTISFNA